jgi:hypothetical protein
MGLELTVGRPSDVFVAQHARAVAKQLQQGYPGSLAFPLFMKPWRSEELPWSGWAELQARVAELLEHPRPFHLGSVEAWSGVFLPLELDPAELEIPGSDTPLQLASAWGLDRELRAYAQLRALPLGAAELNALFERYVEDEDSNYDLQVFSQLMQAVHVARERMQPLWVVK